MKRYLFDCETFHIQVDADDDGIIRRIDPIGRKFLDRHLEAFIVWIRKYGAVETRVTELPPKLFE